MRGAVNGPTPTVWSADGTDIAYFRSGVPAVTADAPALLLVHGTSADHTTFRVVAPMFAETREVIAIDRRGRGASDDTLPYAIEREFEDLVAVAEGVAATSGAGRVDVFGHSYGGRIALGAALRTPAIRRVICHEGAPSPVGSSYHPSGLAEELAGLLAAGDPEAALATFMHRVVGMSDDDVAAYRANPVWPRRVAAAPTIVRELAAEGDPAGSLDVLGSVQQPVLQILGGASRPALRAATLALDARLAHGSILEIPGARHAAHHTHPDAVVAATFDFLQATR